MERTYMERVRHSINSRPAIAFYQKTLGAEMLEEWRTLRLEGDGIDRLASLSSTDSQGRSS